uniref:Putative DNA binding, helix-turn-helix domain containing protein n=1 Tax=viral metagenome TaxID=1070528 RepID=A0A6M3LBY9_9ZZZZ
MLSTAKAAKALGVSVRRVQAMCESGRLPADKVGRDWVIKSSDLKLISVRKPGRPPKKG